MKREDSSLCNSLDDIRENIDKIDIELVNLIAKRSKFVFQAAQFKKSTTEVLAIDRVNAVISKVRVLAQEANLDPSITEKTYRAMIKAFTEQELNTYNSLYKEMKQSYY